MQNNQLLTLSFRSSSRKAADLSPVTCGVGMCEYPNECTAEAAGYLPEECCPAMADGVACRK